MELLPVSKRAAKFKVALGLNQSPFTAIRKSLGDKPRLERLGGGKVHGNMRGKLAYQVIPPKTN
jgi:hypothetical protein